jgi:adenylate cyclase
MINKILSIIFVLGLLIWNPYPLQVLELKTFDWLIMNTEPVQNQQILIVDLDEDFIKENGGWPLPRSVYGDLITTTNAVPGITVLMPNKDIRDDRYDTYFSFRMSKRPTVLATAASTQVESAGTPIGTARLGKDPLPWLYQYPGILQLTPVLAVSAAGQGVVTASPELDGVTRRIPLVVNSQEKLYPSFGLELLRVAVGDPSYQLKTNEEGIEWIRIPNYLLINTDANGRIWLNWNTKFYKQTANEFINNAMEAPFVIFGTTAEGITNPVPTPAGAKYPHEIQANILHNLIEGTAPSTPSWAMGVEYAAALLAFFIMAFLSRSIWLSIPALALVTVGSGYATWYLYQSSYLFDVSGIVVLSVLLWAYHTFVSFLSEYQQKLRIKQQFGTYVSPALVKKLQNDPSLLRLGGETKRLTFLFSDIRGFTPISEKYQSDPQGLTSLINRFLDNQTEIILKHGGTIDKYMGDCIMAFWGAPLEDENHKQNATAALLEMKEELEKLNDTLSEEGLAQINTGAGINTGIAVVGNFGSSNRFDYSVLGDSVNLAARLESLCKEYDVGMIISEHSKVDGYDYKFLDEVTVKGKSEPVKIYTIQK